MSTTAPPPDCLALDWDQPTSVLLKQIQECSKPTIRRVKIFTPAKTGKPEEADLKKPEDNQRLLETIRNELGHALEELTIDFAHARGDYDHEVDETGTRYNAHMQRLPLEGLEELLQACHNTLESLVIHTTSYFWVWYPEWDMDSVMEALEPIGKMKILKKLHVDGIPNLVEGGKDLRVALHLFRLSRDLPLLKDCMLTSRYFMQAETKNKGLFHFHIELYPGSYDATPLSVLLDCLGQSSRICSLTMLIWVSEAALLLELVQGVQKNTHLKDLVLCANKIVEHAGGGGFGDRRYDELDIADLTDILSTIYSPSLEALNIEVRDPSRGQGLGEEEGRKLASAVQGSGLQKLRLVVTHNSRQKANALAPILLGLSQNRSIRDFHLELHTNGRRPVSCPPQILTDSLEWNRSLEEHKNKTLQRFKLDLVFRGRTHSSFTLSEKASFCLHLNQRVDRAELQRHLHDAAPWLHALIHNRENTSVAFHLMATNPSIYFSSNTDNSSEAGCSVSAAKKKRGEPTTMRLEPDPTMPKKKARRI